MSMNDFQLTGTLRHIGQTIQVSEKFSKREFVVEVTEGKYPQTIAFQLSKERTDIVDLYGVGQEVTVSFNLNGRVWDSPSGERKYFNTLEAWRIKASTPEAPTPTAAPPAMKATAAEALTGIEPEDDLPF